MKYHAKVGPHEFELDVRDAGDEALEIGLGDRVYRVDPRTIETGEKYSLLLDHRSFSVTVDGDGRRLQLIVDGRSYPVEVEDERERAMRAIAGGSGAGGGVVESVMPGIVRRVDVQAGDQVAAGDRLLVLEAMKMENEIKAESAGVIERVHVSEGQTVETGEALVSISAG